MSQQNPKEAQTKPAFAWSETKWYANCIYCGIENEVSSDASQSGAESSHKCVACGRSFAFRA